MYSNLILEKKKTRQRKPTWKHGILIWTKKHKKKATKVYLEACNPNLVKRGNGCASGRMGTIRYHGGSIALRGGNSPKPK
jgi:hypothetical protein